MELSQAVADRLYVGGQLAHQTGECLMRGQITSVELTGNRLTVHFTWLAEMGDTEWEATDPRPYSVDLSAYDVQDKGNGHFSISRKAPDELTILCPPDDITRLDSGQVRGLWLLTV
jgi:hypothetical protein